MFLIKLFIFLLLFVNIYSGINISSISYATLVNNQHRKIKKSSKDHKKHNKDSYKKKYKLSKDDQRFPQCNGDFNCIKMQKLLNEENQNVLSVENKHINNSNLYQHKEHQFDIKNDTKALKKKNKNNQYQEKFINLQKQKHYDYSQKSKKINQNNKKNNTSIKHKKNNISVKQKKNIEKDIEFLDDSQILKLIDEEQKNVISPKQINVNVRDKGVPYECLLKNYNNNITHVKVNNTNFKKKLEDAKKDLKEHIRQSLIINDVSDDLIEYIINNLHYIESTLEKHNKVSRGKNKIVSCAQKYNIEQKAKNGKLYKQKYMSDLQEIEELFLVDKNALLAIWGIETNYGRYIGKTNAFNALYSACINADSISRLRYFENNLVVLAVLVDQGYFQKDLKSSFDGGIGGCQFMPDSFYKFAVSFSGGKADIINNNIDVLASIGNYLHSIGWRYGEGILTEIELPNIDKCLIGMNTVKTIKEWKQLGVVAHKNKIGEHYMYNDFAKASIIIAHQHNASNEVKKRAFLVYDNYKVILSYNQQLKYGISTGLLFEAIGN